MCARGLSVFADPCVIKLEFPLMAVWCIDILYKYFLLSAL
jgi:hypothetical protein